MKKCKKCSKNKSLEEFSINSKQKDGRATYCKLCFNEYYKSYRKINLNKKKLSEKLYYDKNREDILVKKRVYRKDNNEKIKIKKKVFYNSNKSSINARTKDWREKNPGQVKANNIKRLVREIKATPKWLTKEQMEEINAFYFLSKELAWLNQDGKPHHVDHIIPLQGKNVCGLHVPWNLQLLSAKDNMIKGNKCHLKK